MLINGKRVVSDLFKDKEPNHEDILELYETIQAKLHEVGIYKLDRVEYLKLYLILKYVDMPIGDFDYEGICMRYICE